MRRSYRELDPHHIVATVEALQQRIEERFPGSGLGQVIADLRQVAQETLSRSQWIQKPHLPLRIGVGILSAAIVALGVAIVMNAPTLRVTEFTNLIQAVDSSISSMVYMGAAILFL